MKRIHKQSFWAVVLTGLVLAGCSKSYLDINKDPNRVTDDNVTAEVIFPAAAEAVGASMVGARATGAGAKTPLQFAQDWIGYMAANGDFARDPTETTYNIDFTFGDVLFQRNYATLFNLYQTKVKALAGGDTALAGCAMVLSAKLFQDMVDLFGNIPYSNAFQAAGNVTRPSYDNAQDIYNALQLRLDSAISYFKLTPSKKFIASVDIVNKADLTKWIKFANTLKLRLLIRQSEVSGFNPSAEIAKIFGAGSPGTLVEGETVSVNPGYVNDVNKQSPFYANFGYTPTSPPVIATSSTNPNAYIVNILNSSDDPRATRLFTPVGSAPVGAAYGDEPGNIPPGNQLSYFGPGVLQSPTQDQWILTSFESLFLRAEAAAQGWTNEDAKALYERAVTESFVWLGVEDAANAAAEYMSSYDRADWANAGASRLSKVKFIAFQKYIANTFTDPQESYADQRRLNFLPPGYISLNPSKVSNTLPLRLLYPQSEYTTNAENVNKQGTIDPFKTKLFWEP